jgi:NitT/TauT family transport system permease protein
MDDESEELDIGRRGVELIAFGCFLVFVGVWEGFVRVFDVQPIILPAPSAVALAFYEGVRSGALPRHLTVTLYETVAGFALGAIFGLVLGALIAQSRLLERVVYPYIVAFQTLPKVAIAPLMVVWFGYGLTSKIVITATIAFFPVLANTIAGLRAVPSEQLELMTAFLASRRQILFKLRLPLALPYILVGLDVAAVLAVIGAIVGEFVGAREGLGFLILQKNFVLDTASVFAILIVLGLMGVGLHLVMQFIQRRVLFWTQAPAHSMDAG